jgi:hypothetical protein
MLGVELQTLLGFVQVIHTPACAGWGQGCRRVLRVAMAILSAEIEP